MTAKRRIAAAAAALLAIAVAACVAAFFLGGGKRPAAKRDPFAFDALRTHALAAALIEKPDSDMVRAVASLGGELRQRCERIGFEFTLDGDDGVSDVFFITGDEFGRDGRLDFRRFEKQLSDDGELAVLLDVKGMTASRFKAILENIPLPDVRLWMLSEREWLVTARRAGAQRFYSDVIDVFAFGPAFELFLDGYIEAPWEVFASYAGRRDDIMAAFKGDLSAEVKPEYFVSKDVAPVDWMLPGGTDADIFAKSMREARSVQIVRRGIIEGNMLSRVEGESENAISKWAAGALANPRDSMLLDRLYTLAVNARAFAEVGNLRGAAKCYETMISVRPNDVSALRQYAKTAARLGMLEISRAASRRAAELEK